MAVLSSPVANGDVTVMAEQKIECDNVTDGGNMQKCSGVFEGAPR